jgi:hypothetical protein
LDHYLSAGTERGIVLNAEKTVVLLPRFRSQADRDHAIQLYLERGLLERNTGESARFPCGITITIQC